MIKIYEKLKLIAETEYKDIVTSTKIISKRTIGSAKLRIFFKNQSFLDIWLSASGKYSYHWDNALNVGQFTDMIMLLISLILKPTLNIFITAMKKTFNQVI